MSTTTGDEITVESQYISACANRHENNISCSGNFLLYSRSNCPILYDLIEKRVAAILIGHQDEVNGVRFVQQWDGQSSNKFVISTSHDKTAIIWEVDIPTTTNRAYQQSSPLKDINGLRHKILHTIKSDGDSLFLSMCCIFKPDDQVFLTITTTIEGKVCLWHNDQIKQTIQSKTSFLTSHIHRLSGDIDFKFIFLAGSDNKIHVFHLTDKLNPIAHLSGHNDWTKSIDTLNLPDRRNEFLLASASQDCFIRVWQLKLVEADRYSQHSRTVVSETINSSGDSNNKKFKLLFTLETVLSGHEQIVYGVCWFKSLKKPALQLISCSAEKTIVIWRSTVISQSVQDVTESELQNPNSLCDQTPASAGKWTEICRLGETGEMNLPFLGVCLSNDESIIYAHSLRGAIHSWVRQDSTNTIEWRPQAQMMGHYEPVTDLSWDRSGAYLLSSSLDKTCRMHAVAREDGRWHEIARPQVHGHEINCLVSMKFDKFASGAEEKTIRTYEPTKFFLNSFQALAKSKIPENVKANLENYPSHAQLPALGLSIRGSEKPYDTDDSKEGNNNSSEWYERSKLVEQLAQMNYLDRLPVEEVLLQSTLWWETAKIFGHGNELYALTADPTGSFLASASKANRIDLANVFIWESTKMRRVAAIEHHTLTVTRLKFSPDSHYLLSASRDRTWCLSIKTGELRPAYKKWFGTQKGNSKHERIIWDCCWTQDSKYFITVSRDKKANMWSISRLEFLTRTDCPLPLETLKTEREILDWSNIYSQTFDCSIQAVDSKQIKESLHLFAFGLEDGRLILNLVSVDESSMETQSRIVAQIDKFHHLPIRRLEFKPSNFSIEERSHPDELILASGADDCIVKISKLSGCLNI